jgi:CO/xanthine dehydrogenase Mo-binding subunit
MPIDGPAPAIVNAIRNAGIDVREAPAMPETLLKVATAQGWKPCDSR